MNPTATVDEPAPSFGDRVDINARKARERRSTSTEAQRSRSHGKTTTINFKLTPDFKKRIQAFAKDKDMTVTAMFEALFEKAMAEDSGQ